MSSILSCVLCEAGHFEHPHALGVRAKCADCRREGVVVATLDDERKTLLVNPELAGEGLRLELSAYGDRPSVTCDGCERLRFLGVLPRRGRCPACGDTDLKRIDLGATQAFCDDVCRTDYANGKRWSPR